MADFCKQCSIDIFREDFKDLAGIATPSNILRGLYPIVLCEDCGPIQVDEVGQCISKDCLKKHGDNS